MADRVRMISKTVFQNDRVTVYRADGPDEGELGRAVTVGDVFETDVWHGKELARLGRAAPDGWSLDDVEDPPLEAHHQVSGAELVADRVRRGKKGHGTQAAPIRPTDTERPLSLTGSLYHAASAHDDPGAAAVQANRADGQAAQPHPLPAPAAAPAPAPAPTPQAKPAAAKA